MKLLVVEDDSEMREFLHAHLPREGFVVDAASTGRKAISLFSLYDYDLVILDLNLPDMTGEELLQELQMVKQVPPTLMLTVISDLESKVRLFNAGADDYVEKPFSFKELVARIRVLLRRSRESVPPVLGAGEISLDSVRRTVSKQGHLMHLTSKEFALLEYLLYHRGTVVAKTTLIEHLWDDSADPFSNSFDMHLMNLRKKLGEHDIIRTEHGRGYVID